MAHRLLCRLSCSPFPAESVLKVSSCTCYDGCFRKSVKRDIQGYSSITALNYNYRNLSVHTTVFANRRKRYREYDDAIFKSKYLISPDLCISIGHVHDFNFIRQFHSSSWRLKEESKVEKTVKSLKKEVEEASKTTETKEVPPSAPVVLRKSIGQKIVAELKHYYHGFRLLFIDIRVSSRLLWHILQGKSLSRREHKQLTRTTADLFRLVPFLVFVIVPFMEFLLPVAVKLFPNMLPSTFKEENREQEKLKKQLKMKLEMAKFLQGTIEEMGLRAKKKHGSMKVEEFSSFLNKIREEGIPATTEEIMKFSKLFEDDLTLDNLNRRQLIALCRVLSLTPIGTENFLRFQLIMKLRQLKADDKMIQKEGIESLSTWELQSACRARGMRAIGVSKERLNFQLQQWLDLHLNEEIPPSLLLLSRAMYLPETLSTPEKLEATISSLPETTATGAQLKAAELVGEIDNKAKLDLIKQEEDAIKKEQEAIQQEEEEEEKAKKDQALAGEAVAAATEPPASITVEREEELLVDHAPIIESKPEEELKTPKEEEEKFSSKELEEIESALEEIAEEKELSIEQEEFISLKEDVSEYKEDLEDLKDVIIAKGGDLQDLQESKGAHRLAKKVDKLIDQMHGVIEGLHKEKSDMQEEIEIGEVRIKRSSELKEDDVKREDFIQKLSETKGSIITINETLLALKRLQKIPDETRAQKILQVLDEDSDGIIDVKDALKVIELIGRENVKLSGKQVSEIIELIKQEAVIEEEEKQKEKLEKELHKQAEAVEEKQEQAQ